MDITSDLIETDLPDVRRVGFEKISAGGVRNHRLSDGLWAAEESRRMLLVATLLAEIEQDPAVLGPLPPAAGVLDALAAAQRNGPTGVRRLLLDPQTAAGCAHALDRLRGAPGPEPLWKDLGIVHALALAAAAQAGLTWSTRLPVRNGTVLIPGRGLALIKKTGTALIQKTGTAPVQKTGTALIPETDTVEAHTEDGEIHLTPPGRWWAPHTVRVGTDLPLTVRLDDLDPLREPATRTPPARLTPAAVRRWHKLIAAAWELLCRDHRPEAEAIAAGVVSLVPRRDPGSTSAVFGRIVLAEPPDAVTLAVTLIHEYQHLELGALRKLVPLTGPDDGSLYYAPWRDDPCPLADLMRGAHAFFGITRFWRVRRDTADGAFEYAYARRQTVESVHTVLAAPGLTAHGRRLFEGLRDRLGEWSGDPLDPRIDQLATITADSHRIGWRLRHYRPRDADVAALAGRWAQHRTPHPRHPAPAAIRPHPAAHWEQHIPAAARRQASGTSTPPGGDPLAAGENALLARDPHSARTAFAGAIGRCSPAGHDVPDEEARAWTGLAMSLAAAGDTAAASALSRRPDLVRAVYAESRTAAGPADVAAWLAPVLNGAE